MNPESRRSVRTERGFTLVELAVALSIAGLISGLLLAVWTTTLNFTRRGRAEAEAQQFGRIALATVVRELREAPLASGTVAIWSTADGAPVDAIGFVSARKETAGRPFGMDENGNPSWQTAVYFVHDRPSGVLWRIAQPWEGNLAVPPVEEGRVVVRAVRGVRFARQGDLVTIALQIIAGRREITLETAVLPRN